MTNKCGAGTLVLDTSILVTGTSTGTCIIFDFFFLLSESNLVLKKYIHTQYFIRELFNLAWYLFSSASALPISTKTIASTFKKNLRH